MNLSRVAEMTKVLLISKMRSLQVTKQRNLLLRKNWFAPNSFIAKLRASPWRMGYLAVSSHNASQIALVHRLNLSLSTLLGIGSISARLWSEYLIVSWRVILERICSLQCGSWRSSVRIITWFQVSSLKKLLLSIQRFITSNDKMTTVGIPMVVFFYTLSSFLFKKTLQSLTSECVYLSFLITSWYGRFSQLPQADELLRVLRSLLHIQIL